MPKTETRGRYDYTKDSKKSKINLDYVEELACEIGALRQAYIAGHIDKPQAETLLKTYCEQNQYFGTILRIRKDCQELI